MKVLLVFDVKELGWLGDVIEVNSGYARNYLLPQGLAKVPTEANIKSLAGEKAKRAETRKSMVGSGDRSAKIRTYNFPQGRVTDHRIHLSIHSLKDVLGGDLDQIIGPLTEAEQERLLSEVSSGL